MTDQIYSFRIRRTDGLIGSGRVKAKDQRDATQQVINKYGRIGLTVNMTLLKNQALAMKQWEQHNAN